MNDDVRKCIFTNKESKTKRSIIPRDKADGEIHNWTLYSPMSLEYDKENRMPTDQEMEIHETFYMLELARLKVKYLETKLKDLQEQNGNSKKPPEERKKTAKSTPKKKRKTKKEKEIEAAIHEKEVIQNTNVSEVLENRKDMWD